MMNRHAIKIFSIAQLLVLVLCLEVKAGIQIERNQTVTTFRKAKKLLFKVHGKRGKTIYCSCEYKKKKINFANCGYKYGKYKKRSRRLEWEHIVPAHAFGQSFPEWRDGHPKCKNRKGTYKGRKCASKVNKEFKFMEADLYNLFPSVGSINATRSNFSMANITDSKANTFGNCQVKIARRKVEPPNSVKGDIARIYMYMDSAYPGRGVISKKNRKLFEAWDKLDPVSSEECDRVLKIEQIQGNGNPFVTPKCLEQKK
jgi:deoxyribonuclease-1